ncbi:hypothetical protein CDD80_7402 [Ophiocordyceps camponoti-rufipedis]|uniref:EngB-type G domain-containing protein n=1 Tax=Ophiocordyceps camponoti-rufipedis TaxID=2004952 RepID=A0A2C5YNW2_9HYPO|nr:hypothetical protein CDD80_7402 [Ophiocordyceps camponoti-rufipedis]
MLSALWQPRRRAIARRLLRPARASLSVSARRRLGLRPSPVCGRGHHSYLAESTPPHTSKSCALNYGSRRTSSPLLPDAISPDNMSLKACKAIRQIPGGELTTKIRKKDKGIMYAARDFFLQGCSYLYSAAKYSQHPVNQHVPEVLVLGASNVGKSTFVNALLCRQGASRVSRMPGKTTLMHAFGVGPRPTIAPGLIRQGCAPPKHSLNVIDTPGYGYMSRESWGQGILEYVEKRPTFRGAVLLLSSDKQQPTAEDEWMLDMLARSKMEVLVVLTKADKYRFSWPTRCGDLAKAVSASLKSEKLAVYVVSAAIDVPANIGNSGGMGAVRAAIVEMAGFKLWREKLALSAEKTSYSGPVVPFDEIQPA